jgi:hypothetical protein
MPVASSLRRDRVLFPYRCLRKDAVPQPGTSGAWKTCKGGSGLEPNTHLIRLISSVWARPGWTYQFVVGGSTASLIRSSEQAVVRACASATVPLAPLALHGTLTCVPHERLFD